MINKSSDFVITRMITDRIGLHSVLLSLVIEICCSKTFISRVFKNIYCRVLSAANLIVVISMVERSHGFLGRSSLYANLGLKVEFSHGSVHD